MSERKSTSRRSFLKQGALGAGATVLAGPSGHRVWASGSDVIRVALVGCGGRGAGAVANILQTKGNCKLVAAADAFEEKAKTGIDTLKEMFAKKVDVPPDRIFAGLDAYKKAIDSDADLIVLATPPGFRPMQFEYAVKQGKHVFMEKPVATDAPGIRRVIAANEEAKKKNLIVGVGLHYRHTAEARETVQRIHDGAIGNVGFVRVYYNNPGIWYRNRNPGMTEMEFQCNNWFHFIWTCGDQICEQAIHSIDLGLWMKGERPIAANGMGGGEVRLNGDRSKSQIFDHTFVEFLFADGSRMYSQGRHLANSFVCHGKWAHGDKGVASAHGDIKFHDGSSWKFPGKRGGGHQQEQHDLIEALLRGDTYNEADYGVESTFAAILGREACYSGKSIRWDELLEKGRDYAPKIDGYTLKTTPPVVPGVDGKYPAPLPGQHDAFA